MGIHGWIAMLLGVVLTCGLAIGLMAAVFASDRSGHDERASGLAAADRRGTSSMAPKVREARRS
ncbi:MAG: hypothetical protein AVDCRST_MAG93-9683 [uncultured Chloroflexia bacterium]|uniref:Uncharacterized protein n=1 Tax=uncultured Chloroflexia bacterium TaxID=1672391 RepID=A0A6J4NK34_9CHLR|nr:MAG: hypothetical protein AVDCRST_MAG93-9683 [uncultured Chloroflexia bacterium]